MSVVQILIINFTLSFFIGTISAFAELLSRYKKVRPIFTNPASILYLLINGFSSGLAFYFINEFGLVKNDIWKVVLAGTSSLIILRSSFANIKVGDKNVEAGIGAIMEVFLSYADRKFDQDRSKKDLEEIKLIMRNVDFDKAKVALPILCFNLMKNVSLTEQEKAADEVNKLSNSGLDNLTKSINLGIILSAITDTTLLKSSVNALIESIEFDSNAPSHIDQLDHILNMIQINQNSSNNPNPNP